MLFLSKKFERLWQGKDPFKEVLKLDGKEYRNKEGRRTFQLCIEGRSYFVKVHQGIGWKEIFKNLIQFRLPVIGASNEYFAAQKLSQLGVDTLTPVAFGKKNNNPAKQLSFIITDDLKETVSLEDYCADWRENPPSFSHKKAIIELLARVSRAMHEAGINHRDYYICHFLLARKSLADSKKPQCFLIDLHRAQIRKNVPMRWCVKDLAGLYFSAMDIGLSKRDCYRFMKIYSDSLSIRPFIKDGLWFAVYKKAIALYQKDHGKVPPCINWWL